MLRSVPVWWADRGWRSWPWWPLAALFAALSALRRLAYRQGWCRRERVPVPVIVVGNLAAGGSGKTPVVLWLSARLQQAGWRPGIISRGYGGTARSPTAVGAAASAAQVGDEPVLLARRTGVPVWVGPDRVAVAKALLAAHPEVTVLISDDGLQHYRLVRDLEIVVVDEKMLGNCCPLPAGPLREPLSRAARADLVLANGPLSAPLQQALSARRMADMRLRPGLFYRLTDAAQTAPAQQFAVQRIKAVAGIGRPQRFLETLQALGLTVAEFCAFPDHHRFSAADLALGAADVLLMTEKDAIKCAGLAPAATWVLPVDADIDAAVLNDILEQLDGPQTA